jgi:hypothetical protein
MIVAGGAPGPPKGTSNHEHSAARVANRESHDKKRTGGNCILCCCPLKCRAADQHAEPQATCRSSRRTMRGCVLHIGMPPHQFMMTTMCYWKTVSAQQAIEFKQVRRHAGRYRGKSSLGAGGSRCGSLRVTAALKLVQPCEHVHK